MTNNEYNDVQRILNSQILATAVYQVAAQRILEELDARGFTVDDPAKADGLVNKITDIILETVQGNTNYCVTTASEEDGDLENQA